MKFLFLCLILNALSYSAFSAEDLLSEIVSRKEIRIGMEAGYIPFEMKNKKGGLIGFDVDLAKILAKEMGVKVKFINTEWDGIIPALLTKKFDLIMSGMTVTQKRNLKVNFATPYIIVGQTILLNKKLKGKIKNYRQLNSSKYNVISKLGTTGEQAVKKLLPNAKYRAYQTEQEAALEIMSGKADAFVYDHPYNSIFVNAKGKGKVIHLSTPFTHEPIGMALRKSDPNFLNFLNNFISQVKNDGRYDKLYQKWFKGDKCLSQIK